MTLLPKGLQFTATRSHTFIRAILSLAQSRLQLARDCRVLSMLNPRDLHDLGLSRNKENDSFYHRD
jgi:uncharacterized protein YjiS (DUF1127 family)